ncbi:MAG TPA: hypothetical protein ENN03_03775 [bacterium]|nr:hypothetical protein [bacterium]
MVDGLWSIVAAEGRRGLLSTVCGRGPQGRRAEKPFLNLKISDIAVRMSFPSRLRGINSSGDPVFLFLFKAVQVAVLLYLINASGGVLFFRRKVPKRTSAAEKWPETQPRSLKELKLSRFGFIVAQSALIKEYRDQTTIPSGRSLSSRFRAAIFLRPLKKPSVVFINMNSQHSFGGCFFPFFLR